MNVTQLFLDAAKKYPNRTAIIDKKQSISYAALEKEVLETAAYFRKEGIQKGDRVLVFVPMSIDLYRIVLGLFHCGATAVFLDEWVTKSRMELCCEIAECKGFIGVFKARVFALFSKELRKVPVKLKRTGKSQIIEEITSVSSDDSALITFTTGSTGRPKAADRTHGFLKEQFDALLDEIKPKVEDVDMPILPIVLFMNLGMGCTSVIANSKMSKPEKINVDGITNQMKQHRVNRITSSPIVISKLAEKWAENAAVYKGIEKIFTGGAPVFPKNAKEYKRAFPYTKINIVYGSTEAEPISSISADDLIARESEMPQGLPVGECYHKAEVRIIKISDSGIPKLTNSDFQNLCVSEESIGEIVVSGPHVLKKYYNNEESFAANKIIVDNTVWHRTGDSGRFIGAELFLTGRCGQLIEWNDQLISPFVIENQLQNISGVEMGTLINKNGKRILILETKVPESDLIKNLEDIPYDLIKCMSIPRDPRHNSKIDYAQLIKKDFCSDCR